MRGRTRRPAARMNIRPWPSGPDYTAARGAILADAGIRTVPWRRPGAPHDAIADTNAGCD
jgi:hypothetical protein